MPESLKIESPVTINPLQYSGWDSLLADSPQSCFFQGTGWARVLQETYGHQPFYFSRFSEGRLSALLPVMEVAGFWAGRRGVSLPFSDFCPLLGANESEQNELFDAALELGRKRSWRYFECRSTNAKPNATPSMEFFSHSIDLAQEPVSLFKSLDDATGRGVRKAEKSGLQIKFSSDVEAIQIFYSLHCRTRQRHGLPPQPFRFFKNIVQYILAKGQGFVATALLGREPVAAAVFFHNHRQVLYKFGASNYAFQHLRANNLLMWKAIQYCANCGFRELHLGRTSLANRGLRRFKLSFGAREDKIWYYKYEFAREAFVTDTDRAETWVNGLFRYLPLPLLRLAGRILYPNLS